MLRPILFVASTLLVVAAQAAAILVRWWLVPREPRVVHDAALDPDGGPHWSDAYRNVVQ